MNGNSKTIYEFREYRLIPAERMFMRGESPISLPPKAFDILVVLVENAGELVDNKHMLERVWPDSFVEEANIQVQMSSIRKALGENGKRQYIETVPKVGYRFIAEVRQNGKEVHVEEPQKDSGNLSDLGPETNSDEHDRKSFSTTGTRVRRAGIPIAILSLAACLGLFGFLKQRSARINFDDLSQRLKLSKLTGSGSAFGAAISADGKYAAYQNVNAGKYSIWLMDLGTKSTVQITPPGETMFVGLTFSPGNDFIYYVAADGQANSTSHVYQMPRFGGEAKKVLTGTNSPVGFSPDGKRFAFFRQDVANGETILMTANSDGTDEQRLASRKSPDIFNVGKRPAWSPDGKTIAVIGINSGEKFLRVLTVDVADGTVRNLTSQSWSALQDVTWMHDSDHLLVTAQDDINFGPTQIWSTSVSRGGAAEKITRELISYVGLSLSANSGLILTSQTEAFSNIWISNSEDTDPAKQILSLKGGGRVEMSWTPDGKIVYTSNASGNPNIFVMNADGSDQIQLTSDTYPKRSPVVSPDGRHIAFVSNQAGTEQLWRMDISGQNQRQIGFDWVYRYPQFSPDGKWIVYSTWDNQEKKAYLWKIPFDGGEKVSLSEGTSYTPNVSPDMKLVAYMEKDKQTGKTLINIVPVAGGESINSYEVSSNSMPDALRWSPDGKGVIYQSVRNNMRNFFFQPLGFAEPKQLTDYKYDFPFYCSLSRNMKQLVCLRNTMIRDVLLLSLQE